MKQDTQKTKVLFLMEQPDSDISANVFAYFPDMNYYSEGNIGYGKVTKDNWQEMKTSYAHIGQHSACHIDYANKCREANYSQYSDLLKELIRQGYNNLQILNKQEIEAHRPPTKGELKFGEGATHWLTVDLPHILNKKGDIKKWFVFPKDGLRYYTN